MKSPDESQSFANSDDVSMPSVHTRGAEISSRVAQRSPSSAGGGEYIRPADVRGEGYQRAVKASLRPPRAAQSGDRRSCAAEILFSCRRGIRAGRRPLPFLPFDRRSAGGGQAGSRPARARHSGRQRVSGNAGQTATHARQPDSRSCRHGELLELSGSFRSSDVGRACHWGSLAKSDRLTCGQHGVHPRGRVGRAGLNRLRERSSKLGLFWVGATTARGGRSDPARRTHPPTTGSHPSPVTRHPSSVTRHQSPESYPWRLPWCASEEVAIRLDPVLEGV